MSPLLSLPCLEAEDSDLTNLLVIVPLNEFVNTINHFFKHFVGMSILWKWFTIA